MSTNNAYDDRIQIDRINGPTRKLAGVTYDVFRGELLDHPTGPKEVIVDQTFDLTSLGALFKAGIVIPAGSVVKYLAAQILTTVVAGGTTVKVGFGPNASSTNKYGIIGALTAGTAIQACFATVVAAGETIDIVGVTTAGSAKGDTNISAGSVRVVVIYDMPNVLT